jgi:hypothetical protein
MPLLLAFSTGKFYARRVMISISGAVHAERRTDESTVRRTFWVDVICP